MANDISAVDNREFHVSVWNGTTLHLSGQYYRVAMAHVEKMRKSADLTEILDSEDENAEDYLARTGWKLSDTLNMALEEGKLHIQGDGTSEETYILKGLREFEREMSLPGCCIDEGADDVF